jgi:hypothetical protein
MFANWPPLALFQVQTFGGVYSVELLILNLRSLRGNDRRRDLLCEVSPST